MKKTPVLRGGQGYGQVCSLVILNSLIYFYISSIILFFRQKRPPHYSLVLNETHRPNKTHACTFGQDIEFYLPPRCTVGQPNFWGILQTNFTFEFYPKRDCMPFFGSLRHRYTTTRELQSRPFYLNNSLKMAYFEALGSS